MAGGERTVPHTKKADEEEDDIGQKGRIGEAEIEKEETCVESRGLTKDFKILKIMTSKILGE